MSKGTDYENEVAAVVETELARGDLGLDPTLAVVRRKPSYFSRDRQKDIIFDVSIEVSRRGATSPYWIWVWECKNYSHTVPVDDIEEFHAKLEQVGSDRSKGTMITPVGFDTGTIEYARSKGIGLWRYVPPGSPVWLLEDNWGATDQAVLLALTTPQTNHFRDYGGFYALSTSGQFTANRKVLIRAELADATN